MNKNLYVVLMAGGVGVRFWPYSRNAKPKQFLDVLGTGKTLLQSTFERFLPLCPAENIYVVTHEEHADLVKQQLQISDEQILAEPMRKNTAACIGYASYRILKKNNDAIIIVTPSDHLILKESEFQDVINKAADLAKGQDKLITLGIKPTRPETGYGYIQYHTDKNFAKKVKTFTEKPELSLAKKFLESGDFVWNSGIFIWNVQTIISALEKYLPEMVEVFQEVVIPEFNTPGEKDAVRSAYSQFKNISIDYGIMEKATNVYVCLGDFTWSDLGSWGSMHEISEKDENNNAVSANTLLYDTRNCIIKGDQEKLIVVQGLNGYLIGEFGNVLIVCEKDKEEQFRRFVNDVRTRNGASDYL